MQAESEEGRRGVCSSFILHPSSFIVHRSSFILHLNSLLLALTSTAVIPALAADWPTYRGDSRRSGSTGETLPAKLSPQWVYRPRHVPQPAWAGRGPRTLAGPACFLASVTRPLLLRTAVTRCGCPIFVFSLPDEGLLAWRRTFAILKGAWCRGSCRHDLKGVAEWR